MKHIKPVLLFVLFACVLVSCGNDPARNCSKSVVETMSSYNNFEISLDEAILELNDVYNQYKGIPESRYLLDMIYDMNLCNNLGKYHDDMITDHYDRWKNGLNPEEENRKRMQAYTEAHPNSKLIDGCSAEAVGKDDYYKIYMPGTYEVGYSIPPGEYVLLNNDVDTSTNFGSSAFFEYASDINFNNVTLCESVRLYTVIEVQSGEFLHTYNCTIHSRKRCLDTYYAKSPSGFMECLVKIGEDAPAGLYLLKLSPTNYSGEGLFGLFDGLRRNNLVDCKTIYNDTLYEFYDGECVQLTGLMMTLATQDDKDRVEAEEKAMKDELIKAFSEAEINPYR